MKTFSNLPMLAIAIFSLAGSLGGCKGTQVAAGLHVKVDTDACQEDRTTISVEFIDLDCAKLGDIEGTVKVTFPRKEWLAMKARRLDARIEEHPGK